MVPKDALLHRWSLSLERAGDSTDSTGAFRAMEAVITAEVGTALRDSVVREHVSGLLIHKRHEGEDSEVGFAIVAPVEVADTLGTAVSRHLESHEWQYTVSDTDPILHPAFAEYIRGLQEQAEIALDLHCVPQVELRRHQCFIIRVCCSSADPRYRLHPYLMQHSRAYVRHAAVEPGEGLWSWEHEQFWARCYTPGPTQQHHAPLHLLWNVVLGMTPRRWVDPSAVAARLGIRCD